MYKLHTSCRACGYAKPGANGIKAAPSEKLIEVFDLGVQPLANDFRKAGEERAGFAPLKVLVCPRCFLGQLSVVVSPDILYRNYSYVTSPSLTMQRHFDELCLDIKAEAPDAHSILEIGSNDGKLLGRLKANGYKVMGVEPAENLVEIAKKADIPTFPGMFTAASSLDLPISDVVIARHVFCHIDDWKGFFTGLAGVTHNESLICIEAPYVGNTLSRCEFDQVYHEHLSYLNFKSIVALLEDTPFQLHKVIHYEIHGGAVLLMIRHRESVKKPVGTFDENIGLEQWRAFSEEATNQIARLRVTVQVAAASGKRVAGLGASAKSTVWINACGFTRKDVEFIADNTPQKQLTVSPGTDIPIVDEGAILRELPDYVILWAWNYRYEILDKFAAARSKGVKFIVPVPVIEVV